MCCAVGSSINSLLNRTLPHNGLCIHSGSLHHDQVFDVRAPDADRAAALVQLGWPSGQLPSKTALLRHVQSLVEQEYVDRMVYGDTSAFSCDGGGGGRRHVDFGEHAGLGEDSDGSDGSFGGVDGTGDNLAYRAF